MGGTTSRRHPDRSGIRAFYYSSIVATTAHLDLLRFYAVFLPRDDARVETVASVGVFP